MSKLTDKVSDIFGFRLKEGEWQKYLPELDREGEPTRKNMAALLFAVCEDLEELRKEIDALTPKILGSSTFGQKEVNALPKEKTHAQGTAPRRHAHQTA